MKKTIKYFIFVLSLCLTTAFFGQSKKIKLRASVGYIKEMNHAKYLVLTAKFKEGKKFIPAQGASFLVYQNFKNDSSLLIAKAILTKQGRAKIKLHKNIDNQNLNFSIKLLDTIKFKPLLKNLKIKDAYLATQIVNENQKNFIVISLTDAYTKMPLSRKPLSVYVKRSFKELNLGDKELYFTDKEGRVRVLIPKGIPAINNILTLNVALEEDDTYGTVKAFAVTRLGETINEDTSFDERKLWSARGKEPMFLFLLSVSLIVIIWTAIIHVIYNIFKISKP